MTRLAVFIGCVLALFTSAAGQQAEPGIELGNVVRQFRQAYRGWDVAGMTKAAETLDEVVAGAGEDHQTRYWLGVARFHIFLFKAGGLRQTVSKKEFKRLAALARKPLEAALKLKPDDPEIHAMLATLLGIEISRSRMPPVLRGRRLLKHKAKSERYGKKNPRALYLLGVNYLRAPKRFGGPKKGLPILLEAKRLFDNESRAKRDPLDPAWGADECLVFIGRAYAQLGESEKAKRRFAEALERNPKNRLARESLGLKD